MTQDCKICLALVVTLVLARTDASAQSPASPDGIVSGRANSELPAWLRLGGEERVRLEGLGGVGFKPAGNTYLLQRLRLNLDVKPLSWLEFSFQAQDSRVLFTNVSPAPSSRKVPLDLRLGFVQFGDSEAARSACAPGARVLLALTEDWWRTPTGPTSAGPLTACAPLFAGVGSAWTSSPARR